MFNPFFYTVARAVFFKGKQKHLVSEQEENINTYSCVIWPCVLLQAHLY